MMRFSFVTMLVFLLIMILTVEVSALRINEFESNPLGSDSGAEWVELYSEENVNLEGYLLENGDGAIYNLSGSFSGYYVVAFPGQWLDNNDETVYLKLNGDIIDTAGPFADSKNNDQTHSFCDGEWKFTQSTKEAVNSCSAGQTPPPNQQSQAPAQNQQNNNEEEEEIATQEPINNNVPLATSTFEQEKEINEKIVLGNANKNTNYEITKTYKTRIGVIYFFIGFCVLLVVLIALRKL